ncbi:hypothetical protein M3202_13875 [Alkalihalobacillus oceani]|uniref:Uncharacterized protein n=1 Tax=Halalkalibacter oceani TaxID=1653776 RepID=A0A9X2DRK8_9BACI|nr:hypothetical protein [Halalkalibacter oceani]MCM3715173.1 hypothetical protein [Halalkalibacter oceani]
MKKLEEPFFTYWYGESSAPERGKADRSSEETKQEDNEYTRLKKKIQQEAIKRWKKQDKANS